MSIKSPAAMPKSDREFQSWCADTHEQRRSGAGSPVGTVTPRYLGEEYLNTSGPVWFKSTGLTSSSWVALN